MSLKALLGVELPIIQAPMAGVQGSALAVAVSNVGGAGEGVFMFASWRRSRLLYFA
jgi:nitronate monooxygenase